MFKKLFNNKQQMELCACATGELVQLENVPDPVFSEKMMGEGIAIIPSEPLIVAPCDGKISFISDTLHAYGLICSNGLELIVHVGLDTVHLKGTCFECRCAVDEEVKKGDPLVSIKESYFGSPEINFMTPIIMINHQAFKNLNFSKQQYVTKGKDIVVNYEK